MYMNSEQTLDHRWTSGPSPLASWRTNAGPAADQRQLNGLIEDKPPHTDNVMYMISGSYIPFIHEDLLPLKKKYQ